MPDIIAGKRFRVLDLEIRITDALLLSAILLFNALTALGYGRVNGWLNLILKNTLIGLVYIGLLWLTGKVRHRVVFFLLRTASVQLLFAYLFEAVHKLQLILSHDWNDQAVLNLEQFIFGMQPTVWLQQFITPALTEWLMFAYVIYVPIYPILCAIIYFKFGRDHMEDYLFTLGLTNVLCDVGFILYPVAGPMHKIRELFHVPLKGYWFTAAGEYIRLNLHQVGGTIPSPHCAIATVMWIMAYRYQRQLFYALTPIIISLYISTVYGRYHYVTDSIIGIMTAVLVLLIAPIVVRGWNRLGQQEELEPLT